jgi:hypothetical protein
MYEANAERHEGESVDSAASRRETKPFPDGRHRAKDVCGHDISCPYEDREWSGATA